MIQIDDAGSGSFVGGTCIGFYRPETNEYYFDIIPVELYGIENFKKKLYLDCVVEIAEKAFDALKVSRNETIEICRGYMFEKLKLWLADKGFCWYVTQITGKIQEVVEKNFELYTIKMGLPKEYIKYTHYPFHFHKLLRWVLSDYDNRISLCKVGWKSWQKLKNITLSISYEKMEHANYYCLKCGKRIKKGANVAILRFYSNQLNYIYLHKGCEVRQTGIISKTENPPQHFHV
ncbi:hypothetical protein CLHUN_23770 [Ruminiclostridium hungatei]|uniref:Uncharacterized protein n=1 Tax=Ruminiclostridium hungatei TaxID=48256 RepID=A0A1V4SIF0_RUMHU|nr:hypothetical protein [Ruminiclostridium hungatei]OPX43658.1 hypothetical protein CLHUN_23770 [Ruminiclostridium hungatei]